MVKRHDLAEVVERQDSPIEARSPAARLNRWWKRWPVWASIATAGWSLAYGALGLYWTAGGPGFPFGEGDPAGEFSILGGVRAASAAPAIAVLCLFGAMVALLMAATARPTINRPIRVGFLAFAWLTATTLLVIVPDARALVAVAYAPVVLLGAPFGWPPGDYRDAIPWSVINQFVCILGGLAWIATALAYQRRTQPGGRARAEATWTRPVAAARWGRWATVVAAILPLVYAATRGAWALGIPLGVTEEFLRQGQAEGAFGAGASLAAVAIAGSVLTLGLTLRWGEVFPRWIPVLRGKPVPPMLAIVPATVVAVLVTNAGLTFWRRAILGTTSFSLTGGNWAALAPELLWPAWGVALGAATLAYYLRRRARGPTDPSVESSH